MYMFRTYQFWKLIDRTYQIFQHLSTQNKATLDKRWKIIQAIVISIVSNSKQAHKSRGGGGEI